MLAKQQVLKISLLQIPLLKSKESTTVARSSIEETVDEVNENTVQQEILTVHGDNIPQATETCLPIPTVAIPTAGVAVIWEATLLPATAFASDNITSQICNKKQTSLICEYNLILSSITILPPSRVDKKPGSQMTKSPSQTNRASPDQSPNIHLSVTKNNTCQDISMPSLKPIRPAPLNPIYFNQTL